MTPQNTLDLLYKKECPFFLALEQRDKKMKIEWLDNTGSLFFQNDILTGHAPGYESKKKVSL